MPVRNPESPTYESGNTERFTALTSGLRIHTESTLIPIVLEKPEEMSPDAYFQLASQADLMFGQMVFPYLINTRKATGVPLLAIAQEHAQAYWKEVLSQNPPPRLGRFGIFRMLYLEAHDRIILEGEKQLASKSSASIRKPILPLIVR